MCLVCELISQARSASAAAVDVTVACPECAYVINFNGTLIAGDKQRPPREGDYMHCPNCVTLLRLGTIGVLLKTAGIPEDASPAQRDALKNVRDFLIKEKDAREKAGAAERARMS